VPCRYGAALGGLNGAPAEISERTLREVYLKPWRAFAAAGGKGAMTAHNTVLNRPCHANPYLVNDILRTEFGFGDGIIISDCNDIEALVSFRVAEDMPHAAAKGLLGGVDWDLQCGGSSAYTSLGDALAANLVNESTIELAAKRSLMEKFAVGLFDSPYTSDGGISALNSLANQKLALRAAEEGVVLLKNTRNVLPLPAGKPLKIAVIGPNGHMTKDSDRVNYLGSYTNWDPAGNVKVPTIFESLVQHYTSTSESVSVQFSQGASIDANDLSMIAAAVTLAQASDVVVLAIGDSMKSSGEWGDRDSLDLPGSQMPLLAAIANLSTPCVMVHIGGRTATFGADNALLGQVDAFMTAFRPGQMGGVAIANILTGITSPSGKLAQNWVRNAGQSMSGASPWLQWRVGKWVANHRGTPDPVSR
jgi:beta-glucosidase